MAPARHPWTADAAGWQPGGWRQAPCSGRQAAVRLTGLHEYRGYRGEQAAARGRVHSRAWHGPGDCWGCVIWIHVGGATQQPRLAKPRMAPAVRD